MGYYVYDETNRTDLSVKEGYLIYISKTMRQWLN